MACQQRSRAPRGLVRRQGRPRSMCADADAERVSPSRQGRRHGGRAWRPALEVSADTAPSARRKTPRARARRVRVGNCRHAARAGRPPYRTRGAAGRRRDRRDEEPGAGGLQRAQPSPGPSITRVLGEAPDDVDRLAGRRGRASRPRLSRRTALQPRPSVRTASCAGYWAPARRCAAAARTRRTTATRAVGELLDQHGAGS